jgi:hypothetical protein
LNVSLFNACLAKNRGEGPILGLDEWYLCMNHSILRGLTRRVVHAKLVITSKRL